MARETVTEVKLNGRNVTTETEVSFKGERGRFTFKSAVMEDGKILWLTVYGGAGQDRKFRSFSPESIRKVHRMVKIPHNVAKQKGKIK